MWSRGVGDDSSVGVHLPVMPKEVISFLDPKGARLVVDGTCGEGGHSRLLLSHLSSDAVLLLIDRDVEILKVAKMRLGDDERVRFVAGSYADIPDILSALGLKQRADAVFIDLGMSSYHIRSKERGFSFDSSSLDMRYDRSGGMTAEEFLMEATEGEIEAVLRNYGEERMARRIAKAIVYERKKRRIGSGEQLARLVERTVGRRRRLHPATRTFQALRIHINDELGHLKRFLDKLPDVVGRGGRFVSIAFHSLEDRLIKRALSEYAESGILRVLTKKVVRPTTEEVRSNPRARSARLRAAEVLL